MIKCVHCGTENIVAFVKYKRNDETLYLALCQKCANLQEMRYD